MISELPYRLPCQDLFGESLGGLPERGSLVPLLVPPLLESLVESSTPRLSNLHLFCVSYNWIS